ncbi:MAG TPA: hypothetical protein VNI20_10820 [Fimbriimonadaceae bacterium]|nr:hypothetical protein [Fimbriimonadaceae bacterium]
MDLSDYQESLSDFDHLSIKDLLEAQDLYHVHLMRHPNVVATAISRYRVRRGDSWPSKSGAGNVHGKGERTLENSEVRPYSWPCVLVFVKDWCAEDAFYGGKYMPHEMVPKTLYLPDGRRVPVCVVKAPRDARRPASKTVAFPLNNIGGGRPILARVQGQDHVATVACLVRDGHKTYALTNRHVTGEPGEVLYTDRSGRLERVGTSSSKQVTRLAFTDVYPSYAGRDTWVNLDIGLVDVDDLDDWTAQVEDIGTVGPMVDLSDHSMSLALIGCHVRGRGAAGGLMEGEIHALFYRYKSLGGFDYVADFFIGPRTVGRRQTELATVPGDSGTLWLLEPREHKSKKKGEDGGPQSLPLAVQWGADELQSSGQGTQPYVLATCLSTVCNRLEVDLVRDWNLDAPETWGAVGHFSIAASVIGALSSKNKKLVALMSNNASLIAPDSATILTNEFKGMGTQEFVHLADVPDFFWKHGKQGHSRPFEGPNHFADMDQPDENGDDLLKLCRSGKNIDPAVWDAFYDSVTDLLSGKKITARHRGLLPFRVWQIYDEMVRYASEGKANEFACAAGVLTHYVGDACQPLHISYLHDGDPLRSTEHTVNHKNGTTETVDKPLGVGVHAAYEDVMVNAHRQDILDALKKIKKVRASEHVSSGFEAAKATVSLMRATFRSLPPARIVDEFAGFKGNKSEKAAHLWDKFGTGTLRSMQKGTSLLAALWESAWIQGGGETKVKSTKAMTKQQAMNVCAENSFLPSLSISGISKVLK